MKTLNQHIDGFVKHILELLSLVWILIISLIVFKIIIYILSICKKKKKN